MIPTRKRISTYWLPGRLLNAVTWNTIKFSLAILMRKNEKFLYDASSFANGAGGDLIFGVRDQRRNNGVPDASITTEMSRLENLLQTSVAPRISGIRFRRVTGFASGSVLIVRIPKSWAAPHMVTFRGATRFYSRNSTGKYPLDVYEIRSAFALSESLHERLSKFRDGRLASINSNRKVRG